MHRRRRSAKLVQRTEFGVDRRRRQFAQRPARAVAWTSQIEIDGIVAALRPIIVVKESNAGSACSCGWSPDRSRCRTAAKRGCENQRHAVESNACENGSTASASRRRAAAPRVEARMRQAKQRRRCARRRG
jgi:hypothetical protein